MIGTSAPTVSIGATDAAGTFETTSFRPSLSARTCTVKELTRALSLAATAAVRDEAGLTVARRVDASGLLAVDAAEGAVGPAGSTFRCQSATAIEALERAVARLI